MARHSENLSSAQEQFELAVEIDPEFALAWVGIADTHSEKGTQAQLGGVRGAQAPPFSCTTVGNYG